MRAMVLHGQALIDTRPLRLEEVPEPAVGLHDVMVRIEACGICRTDLHVIEGDLPPVKVPVIPGHQIVGRVVDRGGEAQRFEVGDRVGIAWLRETDGTCRYCLRGNENLCYYERTVRSVTANTRQDGVELLELAAAIPIRTHTVTFALDEANEALYRLQHDQIRGAGVLLIVG